MTGPSDLSHGAGGYFRSAAEMSFDDALQRRFRYHLLRLTVFGLTDDDVADLGELARLAFENSDPTQQIAKIKQREDVSPLAFAIADIVEQGSSRGSVDLSVVLLGAVLGAYTTQSGIADLDSTTIAIVGAIGGAVAASTSTVIRDMIDQIGLPEYLAMNG
jgi:hypothetical protein